MGMEAVLTRLRAGENPGGHRMEAAFDEIMTGQVNEERLVEFLEKLNTVGPTDEEITACVKVMRAKTVPIPFGELGAGEKAAGLKFIDTCGTGGDGANTINISTLAAIGFAGLGLEKYRISKHGNRSVSSPHGSADLLEALGVDLQMSPAAVARCILEAGIGFFFAPGWHPAMKHVMPARKKIGQRTIFNILGPLTNPLAPQFQIVGVFSPDLLDTYAHVLRDLRVEGALVIHGSLEPGEDGSPGVLDEISPRGKTEYRLVKAPRGEDPGEIESGSWTMADFGLSEFSDADMAAIQVTSAEDSLTKAKAILAGEGGPALDLVAVQCAALLFLLGEETDLARGVERGRQSFLSGQAARVVDSWVKTGKT